jgi:GDPmannose 4,6-dehydratase
MKTACISGITGQDGSYLAELLLAQGYEVHGLVRRVALEDQRLRLGRLTDVADRVHLHAAGLENMASVFSAVREIQPQEFYHLAAQSYVPYSFDDAFTTLRTNIEGTHFVLEALRQCAPDCRVYFAGTSEMFGNAAVTPQNEDTPFQPRSPYGISKVAGYHLARNYREAYGMYVSCGLLFNHESPRRGYEFVSRKISAQVARIRAGTATDLALGNLDARRDWGYAKDFVDAMPRMLALDEPRDFVIATGQTHSVRDFCELAFARAGLDHRDYVRTDDALRRPAEVHDLCGDFSRARRELDWSPSCTFPELVAMMVDHDLALQQA